MAAFMELMTKAIQDDDYATITQQTCDVVHHLCVFPYEQEDDDKMLLNALLKAYKHGTKDQWAIEPTDEDELIEAFDKVYGISVREHFCEKPEPCPDCLKQAICQGRRDCEPYANVLSMAVIAKCCTSNAHFPSEHILSDAFLCTLFSALWDDDKYKAEAFALFLMMAQLRAIDKTCLMTGDNAEHGSDLLYNLYEINIQPFFEARQGIGSQRLKQLLGRKGVSEKHFNDFANKLFNGKISLKPGKLLEGAQKALFYGQPDTDQYLKQLFDVIYIREAGEAA